MSDRKAAARSRFDRWAPHYERDRRSRANTRPQQHALKTLRLRAEDRLLDVGCGTGAAVRAAAATAGRAVGLDLSQGMIDRARELAAGLGNAEFVVGDSEQLPFPDAIFTAVLCSSAFHHYPEPKQALAEMARVLVPGGRLVVAEPDADLLAVRIADLILRRFDRGHVRIYRRDELASLARAAGFERVTAEASPVRGYLILTARRS